MGESRELGREIIACLSGRLHRALPAIAVLFLGCGVASESSPVAPPAVAADVFTEQPQPGHAFIVTFAGIGSDGIAVTGEAEATTVDICGWTLVFKQRIEILRPQNSNSINSGRAGNSMMFTTALIPPGVYPVTWVQICGGYLVYDVDFSHP